MVWQYVCIFWQQGGETVAVSQVSLMRCRWIPISGRLRRSEGQGQKNKKGTGTQKGHPRGHFTNDVLGGFNLPPLQSLARSMPVCGLSSQNAFYCSSAKADKSFPTNCSSPFTLRSSKQQIFNIFTCNGLINHQNSQQVSSIQL